MTVSNSTLRFGISVPNFAEYADPRLVAGLAREAEAAGWDGFFIWDHILIERNWRLPMGDPWIALAAIATATERIRLGPMVTPLARRRPWKVARETVTLDQLSGGRTILGVGLGHPPEAEYAAFGEEPDAKVRARKLDEGLDVLIDLWRGEPFSYRGEHYRIDDVTFLPRPAQSPRIPIWVAGYWPTRAPFRRAARFDGVVPGLVDQGVGETMSPSDLRAILDYIARQRTESSPFDAVLGGYTRGDDPRAGAELVAPYAEAGLTWWLEDIHGLRGPLKQMRERIRQGPPRT